MTETRSHRSSRFETAWLEILEHPRLAWWLCAVALALTAPSLLLGFHLDDFIGRYLYSDLEGAARLYRIYAGGYGTANGVPADARWQIEQGFAPWWIYEKLLLALFRPISLATHRIDPWPNGAVWMHAHSLVWFGLLVLAAARMYRGFHGALVGGLAAALYAVDHTHGFAVGLITNRHTLIGTAFGVLALDQFIRSRAPRAPRWVAPAGVLFYGFSLLSTEAAVAVLGYVVAYAACVDEAPTARRALAAAPYLLLTIGWRIAYTGLGYGAVGSGMYVDPAREPLAFLSKVVERVPVLVLGQFAAPPAEVYTFLPETGRAILWAVGVFVAIVVLITMWPLLSRRPSARFWATGFSFALVIASASHPSNRLLFFAGFGAMGLIAELWHLHAVEWRGTPVLGTLKFSRAVGALLLFGHLFLSPVALVLGTCSVLLSSPIKEAFDDVGAEAEGRDAVFVTAPDYYSVRLMKMKKEVDREPTPRRWRVLSYGPLRVRLHRIDGRTVELDYDGGILETEPMQLYRDARIPMAVGDEVLLEGLSIVVTEVTKDLRAKRARFTFSESLESDRYRFYFWSPENRFEPLVLPPVGESADLPGAVLRLGLP